MGSPGCGKTTVGKVLSAALGRPVLDIDDDHLETHWGMSVAQKVVVVVFLLLLLLLFCNCCLFLVFIKAILFVSILACTKFILVRLCWRRYISLLKHSRFGYTHERILLKLHRNVHVSGVGL
jgi:hypothetical protein